MSVQRVQVDTPEGLDSAITSYLNQGFTVANRDTAKATMQKTKTPVSSTMIILGLIIPFFGWAFLICYLIIHSSKPAAQIVEIYLPDAAKLT